MSVKLIFWGGGGGRGIGSKICGGTGGGGWVTSIPKCGDATGVCM